MSGSFQRQVEVRILQHLHCRVHFGSGPISSDGMFNWFCKDTNISRVRFDDAFASLAGYGYFADIEVDGEKKFRLSSFGIDWVEDYYLFSQPDKDKEALTYNARFSGTIMIGTRRQKYLDQLAAAETSNKVAIDIQSSAHWGRLGAIAGWIAIPIGIVGIIVAWMVAK